MLRNAVFKENTLQKIIWTLLGLTFLSDFEKEQIFPERLCKFIVLSPEYEFPD